MNAKSSMTNIAGNMQFSGDVKLDSGIRTVTIPAMINPDFSVAYGEFKSVTDYAPIEAQYVFLVCDSKGNKYVSKNAATWQNHDDRYEIHKIDSAGNGSLFHVQQ